MDVIVDGYNLLGSGQGLRGALEHKRTGLIRQLALFQKTTGFSVTLVFDGWKSGALDEVRERRDGITVIFSRQGEKADQVVVRVARENGSGCVVVSSDREVQKSINKFGATAIYAGEFDDILLQMEGRQAAADEFEHEFIESGRENTSRYSKTERRRQEKLKKLRLALK